jgi:molecular chaperone HtpG
METASHLPPHGRGAPAPTHSFTVYLGGLLDLLSDALYTREAVFIRELIQNGVDAIAARQLIEPNWKGKVQIRFFKGDDARWRLSVEDDGIGLSAEEVHQFLSTIGASMKRGELQQHRNDGFIGQFGVGFLSCFLVADEVTLVTRRAGVPESKALQWDGCKEGTYTLVELPGERAAGCCVYLTLKENTRETYDGKRLLAFAKQFAGFLDVPIEFSSLETGTVRVNSQPFPWLKKPVNRGHQQTEWLNFAQNLLRTRFLAAFPIECEQAGVRGIAYVLRETVGALDLAHHMVFLKGMFLSREVEAVAPSEMPFLRCIVNSTRLKPNAAREGLQDAESSLRAVRASVGRALVAYLAELEEEDPRLLGEILYVHNRSFVELAANDTEILNLVAPHIQFETSRGTKSLEELCDSNDTAFFIESYEDFKRVELFASSHNITVINAGYSGTGRLIRRLAQEWPRGSFKATNSRDLRTSITREVEFSTALSALLKRAMKALRTVRASVLLTADPRGRTAATLELPLEESLLRGGTGVIPDFLREFENDENSQRGEPVLHLNTSHPLVQMLCDPALPEHRVHAVICALYHHALVTAREMPSSLEDDLYFQALETLLLGEPGSCL